VIDLARGGCRVGCGEASGDRKGRQCSASVQHLPSMSRPSNRRAYENRKVESTHTSVPTFCVNLQRCTANNRGLLLMQQRSTASKPSDLGVFEHIISAAIVIRVMLPALSLTPLLGTSAAMPSNAYSGTTCTCDTLIVPLTEILGLAGSLGSSSPSCSSAKSHSAVEGANGFSSLTSSATWT